MIEKPKKPRTEATIPQIQTILRNQNPKQLRGEILRMVGKKFRTKTLADIIIITRKRKKLAGKSQNRKVPIWGRKDLLNQVKEETIGLKLLIHQVEIPISTTPRPERHHGKGGRQRRPTSRQAILLLQNASRRVPTILSPNPLSISLRNWKKWLLTNHSQAILREVTNVCRTRKKCFQVLRK